MKAPTRRRLSLALAIALSPRWLIDVDAGWVDIDTDARRLGRVPLRQAVAVRVTCA